MRVYKCSCGWSYVLTKREVFGPIFEDNDATNARIMTREIFAEGYADCQTGLEKHDHPERKAP